MEITGKSPLSLYFHIPFCKKKCPYCHFFVIRDNESQKDLLLDAFFKELKLLKIPPSTSIPSIYFGGGTPSTFGPLRLSKLMAFLKSLDLAIDQECEVTLELNPEDVTLEIMQGFKACGVNRVSLGVQSLNDASLVNIGRSHTRSKAIEAIYHANDAGFDNISIDLMYDRPHQTLEDWEKELEIVKTLPITHLSLYNMTLEEGSAYKRHEKTIRQTLPSEELSLNLHKTALKALEEGGFERYEISAFCKKGLKSVHNLGYWQGRDFYGLGPSAFSYIRGTRLKNVSAFMPYIQSLENGKLAWDFMETLDPSSSRKEMLAIGLRVSIGILIKEFEDKFGALEPSTYEALKKLEQKGLLTNSAGHLRLTSLGQLFYDDVGSMLI